MFSRNAGLVYIKTLYSHVLVIGGVKNSIWYLIKDGHVIGLSCNKKLTLSYSVKLALIIPYESWIYLVMNTPGTHCCYRSICYQHS